MTTQLNKYRQAAGRLLALSWLLPFAVSAQVPVDEDGNELAVYGTSPSAAVAGNEDIPLLSTVDLEELVGPIALYPDDLLAIILPASAYPLQIVDAARFLEALEEDPGLEPDPDWDDSVVALLNYPEVIEFLNDDIDWTWRLGEAVVSQQADVVAAIETFRDRAYAAGNLKSDEHQSVTRNDGVIEITPAADDVIYVPYYEPDQVVVYQPRPVYYYYPRAYPVYYYPYSSAHRFHNDWFWGVATTFRIGWFSDSLHVLHHSYYGHPYFGRQYYDRWCYRRPSISTHNIIYVGGNSTTTVNRYYGGDRWRPRHDRRDYREDRRFNRHRHEQNAFARQPDGDRSRGISRQVERTGIVRHGGYTNRRDRVDADAARQRQRVDRNPITFRQRTERRAEDRGSGPDATARRNRPDATVRRDIVSRWQPTRRYERPARIESQRERRDARSEQRQTRNRPAPETMVKRQLRERQRAEPAPKIARAVPSSRSVRRTDTVERPQVIRSDRRSEKRVGSARPPQVRRPEQPASKNAGQRSPAVRAERSTNRVKKSESGASRKAGRLSARAERRR